MTASDVDVNSTSQVLSNLSQDELNKLFKVGSVYVLLNAPVGMEVGIDFRSWKVGPNFKGLKLIPPGFHVLYYSSLSSTGEFGSRNTLFIHTSPEEVIVKTWNQETESLDSCTTFADKFSLDPYLGSYPLDTYQKWQQITNFITKETLQRVLPSSGIVNSMMTSKFSTVPEFSSEYLNEKKVESRCTNSQTIQDELKFTNFDLKRSFPTNASPTDMTKYSIDKSYLLTHLLKTAYNNDFCNLLGEFQLSYVILLLGFNYDGFEQWKQLLALICMSEEAISTFPELYYKFPEVLFYQLSDGIDFILEDLIGSNQNFLIECFQYLYESLELMPSNTKHRMNKLFDLVHKKFKWTFGDQEEP